MEIIKEVNSLYSIRNDRELVKQKIKKIISDNKNETTIIEILKPILKIDYDVNNRVWSQLIKIRIKRIEQYKYKDVSVNNIIPKIINEYTKNHDALYKGRRYDDK